MTTIVRFRTPKGMCAVRAADVLGVRSAREVRPLPSSREDVAGFVEWEGRPVTALQTFGAGGNHVVLFQASGRVLGLVVDEVVGMAGAADSELQAAPAGAGPLVEAMLKTAAGFELLLSTRELGRLAGGAADGAGEMGSAAPPPKLADELPLRMLLVEDNVVVQTLHKRLLGKLGYTVDVAANGKQAIEAMERTRYDLVFMDVQMPEMDGLEAMREISRRWPTARPAVIAMTAGDEATDRDQCVAAGMDDFLAKPAREATIREIVQRWGRVRTAAESRPS